MDDNDRDTSPDKENDKGDSVDLPASTIIGANIGAANAGTFPGGIVAPAADAAAREQKEEEEEEEEEEGRENAEIE
jgi:hypothetical protein